MNPDACVIIPAKLSATVLLMESTTPRIRGMISRSHCDGTRPDSAICASVISCQAFVNLITRDARGRADDLIVALRGPCDLR